MTSNANFEFSFSDRDFNRISSYALREFGLSLDKTKKHLVYSRLTKRLRANNLSSFKNYCELLEGPSENSERSDFLSSMTTNVTQFYREDHHFDFLKKDYVKKLEVLAKAGEKVRIWSAGCSAGQEVYTLAFTLLESFPNASKYDVKILGTDIDSAILEKATNATYPLSQISQIPTTIQKRFISRNEDSVFSINPEVKEIVSFAQLNLIDKWPLKCQFDLIMCRNVAIYFDQNTQERLWRRFSDHLKKDAYLIVGHSERISGSATQFIRPAGITTYQKT